MGLDMFARTLTKHPGLDVDFKLPELESDEKHLELWYWRKHSDLHGWMHKKYQEKGGQDSSFNCSNVVLTLDDLDQLEQDVINNNLPKTTGFFFGGSVGDEEEKKDDLAFIAAARSKIKAGLTVYYKAWY